MARHYGRSANIGELIGRLLQWLIVTTGALVALSVVAPSFQTKDLINTPGIGGLAVGFAFRDIFQNFLAGIILLLTQPFQIGDQISAGGFEGTVEAIETRATTIRTDDGRRVVIPNATLFTETVSVDDLEEARNELLEAIRSVPDVLGDPAPARASHRRPAQSAGHGAQGIDRAKIGRHGDAGRQVQSHVERLRRKRRGGACLCNIIVGTIASWEGCLDDRT